MEENLSPYPSRAKHITDKAVQLWVNDLQDLAYDIEDVLDDLATEALQRKLNQEAHASTSTSKVLKFLPNCCTNFNPRNIMYGRQMSSRLDEITSKLDDLIVLKNNLGLNVNVERSNITDRRFEENSLVDESKIMGREEDKVALMGKLLGNEECDQNVSVVSIVEELNVFNVSKAIFQAVTGKTEDFASLDLLHVALKEKLSKKRFLLVLDDVWNEDRHKWEILQSPLLAGAPGSRIIVTTRSTRVASVMDSEDVYGLDVLSNEDALSLFAQHSLGDKNFDKHPTLNVLGEGIVKKCGRLPLALKTLGRVVKGNRSSDDWEKLLKSDIWDIKDGSEILPALRLSYHHLPPHLKQLFAYCSLIPKDYVFDRNRLILLWMAEGFLSQSKGNRSMEQLGHEYFEELKSRSFFQHATNNELGYTMHDLINDLATSVAGEFSFRSDGEIDASDMNGTFDKFIHFSLIGSGSGSYTKLKELHRAKRLRTFLLMSGDLKIDDLVNKVLVELPLELQFLRVLSVVELTPHRNLTLGSLSITKLPQSIGSFKHLRHLNFSCTRITCLPEQVSDLYNLQSLLVNNCYWLLSLPRSFAKLINLRHLDISDTPKVEKMPLGIGGLTSLQTLSKVIVEEANGFKISDLKGLSDLQGQLSIMGLDKVIDPIQAKDANLHQKTGIDVLEMKWSDVFDDSRNEIIEYEVLKELRPHPKLKNLKISFYNGTGFPSWVGDPSFDQLTELKLCGCRSTNIPTLGHLRSLKKLIVEKMNEVKTVGFELLAPTNSNLGIAFPSLEALKFYDMKSWQRWSIDIGGDHGTPTSFPRLHEISINSCPELAEVSIGLIPSLRVLHVEECSKAVLRSMIGLSPSLVELNMSSVKGLTQLRGEDLMHLGAVENLCINRCDDLIYLWEQESEACKSLVSLQGLEVLNCKKLVSSAEKDDKIGIIMESLKAVTFHQCDTLESYNCANTVEIVSILECDSFTSLSLSTLQEHPSSLTELIISDCDKIQPIQAKGSGLLPVFCLKYLFIITCKNLKSFPYEQFQSLTSLEQVMITGCPSMDYSFPCGLWPPNLTTLTIGCLNKPMTQWGPQNFPTSLVELNLHGENSGVVSFEAADDVRNTTPTPSSCFLLPPSLVSLELKFFEDVESFSEVLQHLPCLKTLDIESCPKIRDVVTTVCPSNLTITVRE